MTRLFASLLLSGACLAAHAQDHAHAASDEAIGFPSSIAIRLDDATLAAQPRVPVEAHAHGQALRCEGIALHALLIAGGAIGAAPLRGAQLARYVRVQARDGYRAVYSLAELDPTLGNARVFVVDRCDGKPLDDDDGPLRLIAPGDARPARWVRQIASISVDAAP